jgi:hypothetical protein
MKPTWWTTYPQSIGSLYLYKNPQHAFLRKGSKAVCPVSQICSTKKNPVGLRGSRIPQAKLFGHFTFEVLSFANCGLQRSSRFGALCRCAPTLEQHGCPLEMKRSNQSDAVHKGPAYDLSAYGVTPAAYQSTNLPPDGGLLASPKQVEV